MEYKEGVVLGDWIFREKYLSPSSKYRLLVYGRTTGPHTWGVTCGVVYRSGPGTEEEIACIERNYSSFPHLFIEGHGAGDFLLCGERYDRMTVVNLSSGDVVTFNPSKGFCTSDMLYCQDTKTLAVDGCYWGSNGEVIFYDLSGDISNGFPELTIEGEKYPAIDNWAEGYPKLVAPGSFEVAMTHDGEWADPPKENEYNEVTMLRRSGNKMVKVSTRFEDLPKEVEE